eukprot:296249_1
MASLNNHPVHPHRQHFIWQIPSLSDEHKLWICITYAQQHFNKYITLPVIHLISQYYTNNSLTLQQIKSASTKQLFISPIFSLCSFKFYLRLYPNGSNNNNPGSFILLLCLASFPPNLQMIRTSYMVSLMEINNVSITRSFSFSDKQRNAIAWRSRSYSHRNIHNLSLDSIQHIKQLSFFIDLSVLKIIHKTGNDVFNAYFNKYISPPMKFPVVSHKCTFNDKRTKHYTAFSEAHQYNQFKWYLKFCYHKDGTIGVYLKFIPFPKGISAICLKYSLYLQQIQRTFPRVNSKFYSNTLSRGVHIKNEKIIQQIKNTKQLTVCIDFTIYDIYDENNNVIPSSQLSHFTSKNMKLPVAKYELSVTKNDEIQSIKNSAVGQQFQNKIFKIGDLKWCVSIFPNGYTNEDAGKFLVDLGLISLPPIFSKLVSILKITFCELNKKIYFNLSVEKMQTYEELWILAPFDEIKHLQTITITIEFTILDFCDHNGNRIENYIDEYKFEGLNNFPIIDYEWKITNENILNKMRNAANSCVFTSRVFLACGIKWYLSIYPNGSRTTRKGNVNIFLHCMAVENVVVYVDLQWVESNKTEGFCEIFRSDNCMALVAAGITGWPLKPESLCKLDAITVRIKITLIDVYKNNKIVTQYYDNRYGIRHISLPSNKYKWILEEKVLNKIKTYGRGISYTSDIFKMYGMSCYLEIFPYGQSLEKDEGSTICINVISLPFINALIGIRFTLCIQELGIKHMYGGLFDKCHLCIPWGPDRMSCDQFKSLNKCTIDLTLELLDVFDKNDNITQQFCKSNYMKMSDIGKLELDNMINKMSILNQLQGNMSIKHKCDVELFENMEYDESDELKCWLYEVGLLQYYKVFIDNNIDCLFMMKMIRMDDLDKIGIKNIGHKLQILIAIASLNT